MSKSEVGGGVNVRQWVCIVIVCVLLGIVLSTGSGFATVIVFGTGLVMLLTGVAGFLCLVSKEFREWLIASVKKVVTPENPKEPGLTVNPNEPGGGRQ